MPVGPGANDGSSFSSSPSLGLGLGIPLGLLLFGAGGLLATSAATGVPLAQLVGRLKDTLLQGLQAPSPSFRMSSIGTPEATQQRLIMLGGANESTGLLRGP
jgi:hypothetical protein